jgi:hypothetical protein
MHLFGLARRGLPLLLGLCLLPLALAIPASYGQEGSQQITSVGGSVRAVERSSVSVAAPAPQGAAPGAYLPLVVRAPELVITFGTELGPGDQVINPGTVFPSGQVRLAYSIRMAGVQAEAFRYEFIINGVNQAGLGDSGFVPFDDTVIANQICFVQSGSTGCSGRPLDPGTYTIRLFVGDRAPVEATAVIQ